MRLVDRTDGSAGQARRVGPGSAQCGDAVALAGSLMRLVVGFRLRRRWVSSRSWPVKRNYWTSARVVLSASRTKKEERMADISMETDLAQRLAELEADVALRKASEAEQAAAALRRRNRAADEVAR